MPPHLRRLGIVGLGAEAAGLAALAADAGLRVLVAPGADHEPGPAVRHLVERSVSPALHARDRLALIDVVGGQEGWAALGGCDWIVEAGEGPLPVRRAALERIEQVRGAGSVVSSVPGGLTAGALASGRSEALRSRYLIFQVAAPARTSRLVEVALLPDTDRTLVDWLLHVLLVRLGKNPVLVRDVPLLVAARLQLAAVLAALHAMTSLDLQVDEVDAILGPAAGRPRTAVFAALDEIGLDNFLAGVSMLRAGEPERSASTLFALPPWLSGLATRRPRDDETPRFHVTRSDGSGGDTACVLDWRSGEYRPSARPRFAATGRALKARTAAERLQELAADQERVGALTRLVVSATMAYASHLVGPVADTVVDVDDIARWGLGWELGPFEAADAIGAAPTTAALAGTGVAPSVWASARLGQGGAFYEWPTLGRQYFDLAAGACRAVTRPPHLLVLSEIKSRKGTVCYENPGATLVDLGDGVACLEFHSTINPSLNPIDEGMGEAFVRAGEIVARDFRALVVHHQAAHFSAGANLNFLLDNARNQRWAAIEQSARAFQDGLQAIRYAPFPIVTAPFGLTLGGGAEIALAAPNKLVHAALSIGLPEAGVGLVPAGGGHLRLIDIALGGIDPPVAGNLPLLQKPFEAIARGTVSTSAAHARALGLLRAGDRIEMNRDRMLFAAKTLAVFLDELGYAPPLPGTYHLPGVAGIDAFKAKLAQMRGGGLASDHDVTIATHVATILCGGASHAGGPVSEARILELEREAFVSLSGEPKTQERIAHMLAHKTALRN